MTDAIKDIGVTWQSLRREALRRIQSGLWPPGAQIPHEADLATEFGCARATVNRALRDLAEAGYLERKRKGGTRVALTPVRKAVFDISIIRHDVEARGQAHGYRLLGETLRPAPDDICAALNLPAPLRHIRALHLADGQPFCLEDRWLNPAIAADIRFDTLSANEWLVRHIPVSGGDFSFFAAPANAEQADSLSCAQGAALFSIARTTFSDDEAITAVTLSYAPGFRMVTAL